MKKASMQKRRVTHRADQNQSSQKTGILWAGGALMEHNMGSMGLGQSEGWEEAWTKGGLLGESDLALLGLSVTFDSM